MGATQTSFCLSYNVSRRVKSNETDRVYGFGHLIATSKYLTKIENTFLIWKSISTVSDRYTRPLNHTVEHNVVNTIALPEGIF